MTGRVIWLNGPFGVGKTTTAAALRQARVCRIVDPEWIGAMVETFMLPEPVEDFQHVPVWRALVVQTLVTVCAHTDDLIVVPMTVLDRQVAGEIFGGLADRGITVTHVLLDMEETVLRERIRVSDEHPADAALSANTRAWRVSRVGDYLRARSWLCESARAVITADDSPDRVAAQVVKVARGVVAEGNR